MPCKRRKRKFFFDALLPSALGCMCLPFASLLMARTSANTRSPPSSKALTLNLLRAYLSARSSLFFFPFQWTSIIHLLLCPITKLSRVWVIAMAGLPERESGFREMMLTCPVSFQPTPKSFYCARRCTSLYSPAQL